MYSSGVGFARVSATDYLIGPDIGRSDVSGKYSRGMESSRCTYGRSHCMHAGPSMVKGSSRLLAGGAGGRKVEKKKKQPRVEVTTRKP